MSRLSFVAANHVYWLLDPDTGKKARVPSVSALKKTLHPFEGERYFLGIAADVAADQWPQLADLAPTSRRAAILALALDRAAVPREFGTAVHYYCEHLWTGEPVEVPEDYVTHVKAVADWWTTENVTLVDAERMCWAEGDEYGAGPMAGRFDLIVQHPTLGTGLLDLKTWMASSTGQARLDEWAFQLAAYASMEWMVNELGADVPMPHLDWCGVLHVGPGGCDFYLLPDADRRRATDRVLCARALKALPKPGMTAVTL